jgi:branched-chain amino acid aminotransferase
MQNAIINVNGNILEVGLGPDLLLDAHPESRISVFDRGFLYGDSLYEVVRTYGGEFLYLDEHLKRLESSAHLCKMKLGQNIEFYRSEMHKTLRAFCNLPENQNTQAYCRIIVTRGVGKIGFSQSCLLSTTQYVMIVQAVDVFSRAQFEKGLNLKISQRLRNDPRALDPAMKSGNYLNSLLAYLEAEEEGYADAILCNAAGYVTEGTTFNLFYVKRGILVTPPLDIGILDGITRRKVIQVAENLGLSVREVRFTRERLFCADEIFVTSTIKEVFPVTQLDHTQIGNGQPGPWTRKLREHYRSAL